MHQPSKLTSLDTVTDWIGIRGIKSLLFNKLFFFLELQTVDNACKAVLIFLYFYQFKFCAVLYAHLHFNDTLSLYQPKYWWFTIQSTSLWLDGCWKGFCLKNNWISLSCYRSNGWFQDVYVHEKENTKLIHYLIMSFMTHNILLPKLYNWLARMWCNNSIWYAM